jgi:hypothetical protein
VIQPEFDAFTVYGAPKPEGKRSSIQMECHVRSTILRILSQFIRSTRGSSRTHPRASTIYYGIQISDDLQQYVAAQITTVVATVMLD